MANKKVDMTKYLKNAQASGQWGIPDPAGTARGRLAQFRRGLVGPGAAQTQQEKWAFGAEPGKEMQAINAGMEAANAAQTASIEAQKARALKNQARRIGGDVPEGQVGFGGYYEPTVDKENLEFNREKMLAGAGGWSVSDYNEYVKGTGEKYLNDIRFSQMRTPSEELAHAEKVSDKLQSIEAVIWRMAELVAMGSYTTPAKLEKYGEFKTYMYAWQRNNNIQDLSTLQDIAGLGVSSKTPEGKETINNYKAYVASQIAWNGLPEWLVPMAMNNITPLPIEMIVATGALKVGDRVPAELATTFGYQLPESAVDLVVSRDAAGKIIVGYTKTPAPVSSVVTYPTQAEIETQGAIEYENAMAAASVQPTPTVTPEPTIPEPIVTPEEEIIWFDSEELRVRDWSVPQTLTADEVKYYFDIEGELPENSTFTVVMDGETPLLTEKTVDGWTTTYHTDGTNTYTSPDGVEYDDTTLAIYKENYLTSQSDALRTSPLGGLWVDMLNTTDWKLGADGAYVSFPTGEETLPDGTKPYKEGQALVNVIPSISGIEADKIEVDEDGNSLFSFWGFNEQGKGEYSTYIIPNPNNVFKDEQSDFVIKVGNYYKIDISNPDGFSFLYQSYPFEFLGLVKSMGKTDAAINWLKDEENGYGWTDEQIDSFFNIYTPQQPYNVGDSPLDFFKTAIAGLSTVVGAARDTQGQLINTIVEGVGFTGVDAEELTYFLKTTLEGTEMAALGSVRLPAMTVGQAAQRMGITTLESTGRIGSQTLQEMTGGSTVAGAVGRGVTSYSAVLGVIDLGLGLITTSRASDFEDRVFWDKIETSWKAHGLAMFFNNSVHEAIKAKDDVPSWLVTAGGIAAMFAPVTVPMAFTRKWTMPILFKTVRTGELQMVKHISTEADLRAAAAYKGYKVEPVFEPAHVLEDIGMPTSRPPDRGFFLEVDGQTIRLSTMKEADLFFKTGNKYGYQINPQEFFSDTKKWSFRTYKNGQVTGTIEIYDTQNIFELLKEKFQNFDMVVRHPLYKEGDLDSVRAAIQDLIVKGDIQPKTLAHFANQMNISIREAGAASYKMYKRYINNALKDPMKSLKEENGRIVKGIRGVRPGIPEHVDTLKPANNDVAQYWRYFDFENPAVADWFHTNEEFIDAISAFARSHGEKFGQVEFYDSLSMGHYFPRKVTGVEGLDILRLHADMTKARTFDLMEEGLQQGFKYATIDEAMSAYCHSVYGFVGKKYRDEILKEWYKAILSETLKGQILINSVELAKKYALNSSKAVDRIKNVRAVPSILNKRNYRKWFKDHGFENELKELDEIIGLQKESMDVSMLNDLIARFKKGGKLLPNDWRKLKASFPDDYELLKFLSKTSKTWKRSQTLEKLTARRNIMNKVNKELFSPEDMQGLQPKAIEAMIRDMRLRTIDVIKYNKPVKEAMKGLPSKNRGAYRDLIAALQEYEIKRVNKFRGSNAELEDIDNQISNFLDRNFSELREVSFELNKESKELLDNLVTRIKEAEIKAKEDYAKIKSGKASYAADLALHSERGEASGIDIKGFRNEIFVNQEVQGKLMTGQQIHDIIKKEFDPHLNKIFEKPYKGIRALVTFKATMDDSAPLTFGWYLLGSDTLNLMTGKPTTAWLNATGMSIAELFTTKGLAWYRGNNLKVYEEWLPYGLKIAEEGNDFFSGIGFIQNAIDKNTVSKAIGGFALQPVTRANRAFSAFAEIGRIELIKSQKRNWLLGGGSKMGLIEYADLVLGTLPRWNVPVNPNQVYLEGMMAFAPNFFRSNLLLMGRMLRRGITGRELKKVMLSSWASWTAIYVGLCYASGQEDNMHLYPWDPDFFTFRVGDRVFGLPGFQPVFTRAMAAMFAVACDNPGKLIGINDGGGVGQMLKDWSEVLAPGVRWLGYKQSPGVAFIREMIQHKDAMGQRLDTPGEYGMDFLRMFIPMSIDNLVISERPDNPWSAAAIFFGMRERPMSAWETFEDAVNEYIQTMPSDILDQDLFEKQQRGELVWSDLGPLQNLILAENPDLQELKDKADAAALNFKSDEQLKWRADMTAIDNAEKIWYNANLAGLRSGTKDGLPFTMADYNKARTLQIIYSRGQRDMLKNTYKDLYAMFDQYRIDNEALQANFTIAYNEWYDTVYGPDTISEDGLSVLWDVREAKENAWKEKWDKDGSTGYYEMLQTVIEAGFKDDDPLLLEMWQLEKTLDDYWKIPEDQREAYRQNPDNVMIEAALIFRGHTSTIQNPAAEAIVRQWCSEYGIDADKAIPAFAKLVIPDDMMQKYNITNMNAMREYNELPTAGYDRERYLITNPEFKNYMIGENGLNEFDSQGNPKYTWDSVPTVEEEAFINQYTGITGTNNRKLWRCQHRDAEMALIKFGHISTPVNEEWCQVQLAQTGTSYQAEAAGFQPEIE